MAEAGQSIAENIGALNGSMDEDALLFGLICWIPVVALRRPLMVVIWAVSHPFRD